jgi:splicing factor 3A subunit 1
MLTSPLAIVEKTAGYVARNGPVFEGNMLCNPVASFRLISVDRIREKERQNPKFSFLNSGDAYAPFYEWRLNEVREGRGTAVSAGRVGEAPAPEPEKPKGPAPPPEFHFSARMPNISAQDLEVVRLTALFVARRGKGFMTALSQRETRNYQFDFLRPQHSLYQFFTRLVDQYTELLQSGGIEGSKAEQARIKELELNVKDKFHMLGRAKQRAEWVRYQEKQKEAKEEEEEQERVAYAQIDWHDFVVVESVLFTEADDQADLPPPTSLNDLQSASLEQKAMMSLQPHNMRIEEAMPTDDIGYYDPYQSNTQPAAQLTPAPSPYQQYPPQPQPPGSIPAPMDYEMQPPPPPGQEDEEERLIRERREAQDRAAAAQAAAKGSAGQPMRIRNDYVPRAQARRQAAATAICPNCKQQIPYDELDQHMRSTHFPPRSIKPFANTAPPQSKCSTPAGRNSAQKPTPDSQPPTYPPLTSLTTSNVSRANVAMSSTA